MQMKRIFILLLTLAAMLCACGSTQEETTSLPSAETVETEETTLATVETIPATEETQPPEPEYVLQKAVRTDIDSLGNQTLFPYPDTWTYDEEGRITQRYISSRDIFTTTYGIYGKYCYEYDETGLVTEIQVLSPDGSVYAVITPSYDDTGAHISDHIQTDYGEYDHTYSYNDHGQLMEMHRYSTWPDHYITTYTYDGDRLVQEVCEEYYIYKSGDEVKDATVTIDYTYDADGRLSEKRITQDSYHYKTKLSTVFTDKVVFTYDDQGRLIQQTTTYGTISHSDGTEEAPEYVCQVIDYLYG